MGMQTNHNQPGQPYNDWRFEGPILDPPMRVPSVALRQLAQRLNIALREDGFARDIYRLLYRWQPNHSHQAPKLVTVQTDGSIEEMEPNLSQTGACVT